MTLSPMLKKILIGSTAGAAALVGIGFYEVRKKSAPPPTSLIVTLAPNSLPAVSVPHGSLFAMNAPSGSTILAVETGTLPGSASVLIGSVALYAPGLTSGAGSLIVHWTDSSNAAQTTVIPVTVT